MMIIQEFLQELGDTYLHNMHYVDEQTGLIKANKHRKLLTLIKQGITDIQSKFHLAEQSSLTTTVGSGESIIDMQEVQSDWGDEILEIRQVALIGLMPDGLPLQYLPEPITLVPKAQLQDTLIQKPYYELLEPTVLKIHSPYEQAVYQIQAKIAKKSTKKLTLTDKLPIPVAYHHALGLFIAAASFRAMDNQLDQDMNESMRYMNAYQSEIQSLKLQSYEIDNQPQYHTFYQKGFI